MFDDLAAAGVAPGATVLEIGCGTGQATVPLAERGYRIVAVELGADMAAVARRNLAAFDAVEVVTAAFEEWPLPGEPFDVVFSATAFHWIDPAVRVSKSADALRLGGLLATVGTHHIAGGTWTEAFFVEIQKCYERFDPSTPPGLRLETARDIVEDDRELTSSGRFGPAKFYRYEWELPYSTADYLGDAFVSFVAVPAAFVVGGYQPRSWRCRWLRISLTARLTACWAVVKATTWPALCTL
jgi:SAM-dependent methyltransferase